MTEKLLIELLMKLGALFLTEALKRFSKTEGAKENEGMIDARLAALNAAIKESMTGGPMTPEQRKKLKDAAVDFVRNTPNGNHGL